MNLVFHIPEDGSEVKKMLIVQNPNYEYAALPLYHHYHQNIIQLHMLLTYCAARFMLLDWREMVSYKYPAM